MVIYLVLLSCISFDSYIKPQPRLRYRSYAFVVYLLIPTSNHNLKGEITEFWELYIF